MKIAIIGMGPAGVNVVKTLRNNGFDGSITMFSAENVPPYSPPSLGEYLTTGNETILFWEGRDFCEKHEVVCKAGDRVVQLLPAAKQLRTAQGEIVAFDYCVIASGTSLYAQVGGLDKQGICDFKTLHGTNQIKKLAAAGGHKTAVVLGGGFIGVEISLYLVRLGIRTTLLNRRGWIMPRLLDPETAKYVENDLRSQGVDVLLNTEGKEFQGAEKVEGLLTSDGRILTGDLYIAATGVKPNIDFITQTDIAYRYGIVVNQKLQTKYPYIYACGDVAETIEMVSAESKIQGLYPTAINHGITVGYNILGLERNYQQQINMNSLKKLGFKLIVIGKQEGEELKYKTENVLRKIYLKDDQLVGFVLLDDISNAGIYLSLFTRRTNIAKIKPHLLSKYFNIGFLAGNPEFLAS